jgi:hypothetical protein
LFSSSIARRETIKQSTLLSGPVSVCQAIDNIQISRVCWTINLKKKKSDNSRRAAGNLLSPFTAGPRVSQDCLLFFSCESGCVAGGSSRGRAPRQGEILAFLFSALPRGSCSCAPKLSFRSSFLPLLAYLTCFRTAAYFWGLPGLVVPQDFESSLPHSHDTPCGRAFPYSPLSQSSGFAHMLSRFIFATRCCHVAATERTTTTTQHTHLTSRACARASLSLSLFQHEQKRGRRHELVLPRAT